MPASVKFIASTMLVALLLSAACLRASSEPDFTGKEAPPPPFWLHPTQTPSSAPPPTATPTPYPTFSPGDRARLAEYAASVAGGPGAIYVGDLNQLAGPVPVRVALLDSAEINVTLDSLERHRWLYESDLYQELLRKARLNDPTSLTSSGEEIVIKHACINPELPSCRLLESFFALNLRERTGGQIRFEVSSFWELEVSDSHLASPVYALGLLADGTTDSATVGGYYLADNIPLMGVQRLWGLYLSPEQQFLVNEAIISHVENSVQAETGGAILNHSWHSGVDTYFFCTEPIRASKDFADKKILSHDHLLVDWANGMGANAGIPDYYHPHTVLERRIADCMSISSIAGYYLDLHEVADYLIGPLADFTFAINVINSEKWKDIPEDLRQIMLEEAAKSELETLRIAAEHNEIGLQKNIDEGMEYIEISPEIRQHGFDSAKQHVIPRWIRLTGSYAYGRYQGFDSEAVDAFNRKAGPLVGVGITLNPDTEDGFQITEVPMTQGPYAGKTISEALRE